MIVRRFVGTEKGGGTEIRTVKEWDPTDGSKTDGSFDTYEVSDVVNSRGGPGSERFDYISPLTDKRGVGRYTKRKV